MSQDLVGSINRYYHDTAWDYKYLWMGRTLAIHFGYYDQKVRSHSAALLRMNEILAEKTHIKSNDHVLDAGCGVGGSSIWLAKNKDCSVTGVNIVASQLGEATRNAVHAGADQQVNFLKANYANLPIPSESYDVSWALESIVHAPNKEAVINEAHRVLKNSGRVIIAEYMLRDSPLNPTEQNYLHPWLQGWSMPKLLTALEFQQMLESAGFSSIHITDISTHVAPSLCRLKLLCLLALPGARTMRALGIFTKERIANIEGSLRQVSAFEKGLWSYKIITAEKI